MARIASARRRVPGTYTRAKVSVLRDDPSLPGYRSVADGTRRMADWFATTDFGERHALVFSHDIFIAAFLQGLGVRQFDSAHWVGYLQGAALAQDSDGSWSAFYCVPDKLNFTTAFFQ